MDKSIFEFINSCIKCSEGKYDPKLAKAPLKPIQVSELFLFWALDYMGPMQETTQGNRHIFFMMDHFNKRYEAFPARDKKASAIANFLVSRAFLRFGPPTVLHSDQAINFNSTLMHEIYGIMGIKKFRTTAYCTQGNGKVERLNRTLQEIIANFVSKNQCDWDKWVDQAAFAYNTSVHASTGFSPNELVIELELELPISNPLSQSKCSHYLRKAIQTA